MKPGIAKAAGILINWNDFAELSAACRCWYASTLMAPATSMPSSRQTALPPPESSGLGHSIFAPLRRVLSGAEEGASAIL
ncbi:hypothetical protein VU08_07895 [Desulfobulbus sp. F5]|nr:hypothetical protein [Desulfobulbus sp. F5]